MVAYSFKPMFVHAIRLGLGLEPIDPEPGARRPKRQTIREVGRRRHAFPGDRLQLYTGMRTKQCKLIGEALCTNASSIEIAFRPEPKIYITRPRIRSIADPRKLDLFAQGDGFADWESMAEFWRDVHDDPEHFAGVLIEWKAAA